MRFSLVVALIGMMLLPRVASTASPCGELPRLRVLDFWLGQWTVHVGNELVGRDVIEPIVGGCGVMERWTDVRGSEGVSLFYHDASQDLWKQVWVTDDAPRPGGMKEKAEQKALTAPDRVRFEGRYFTKSGVSVLDRTTLTGNADGTIRQHIETSMDEGQSWHTTFDAVYRRASHSVCTEADDKQTPASEAAAAGLSETAYRKLTKGYTRARQEGGEEQFYCRMLIPHGSRLPKKTCYTLHQLMDMERVRAETRPKLERKQILKTPDVS